MAKLTKFKAQQVEFPTHYKVEDTNRGDTKIKNIIPAFGTIRENGTPETEEIYNGLQLGNVHTLQANKTTNLNIDYYVCNLDGLTEFGLNNDLKLRINVDTKNTNTTTKLRLNNVDYTLLKEYNGTLKQIEAGDFKPNKSYELAYNGNQFVIINIMEYGTETDTVLEGKRLAEIIGLEFGGNIQDAGAKVTGKFYYDKALKYYYECIANNNLTYNDGSKFRAISNKPILDKVENLSKVQQAKLYVHAEAIGQGRTTCNIVEKVGNIVTIIFDSGNALRNINDNTVIFQIPDGFKPKTFLSVNASQYNTSNGTVYIEPSGIGKWKGATVNSASIIFSVSYIV